MMFFAFFDAFLDDIRKNISINDSKINFFYLIMKKLLYYPL